MTKIKLSVILSFLFFLTLVSAGQKSNIDFFQKAPTLDEVEFVKIGQGKRKYFLVEVYEAALYADKHPTRPTVKDLLAESSAQIIRVKYNYEVDKQSTKEAWKEAIAQNCTKYCERTSQDSLMFLKKIENITPGEIQEYQFLKEGLRVLKDDQDWIKIDSPDFSKIILMTFIGEHPPTQKLKKGLLGG